MVRHQYSLRLKPLVQYLYTKYEVSSKWNSVRKTFNTKHNQDIALFCQCLLYGKLAIQYVSVKYALQVFKIVYFAKGSAVPINIYMFIVCFY